jgi:regulator of sirC expression with transglutaminase-like and TPR domain
MESLPQSQSASAGFSESEKTALLKLLCDEDESIYQTVRTRIISGGLTSDLWMRTHALSEDPVLRRRSQEIVRYFARQTADNRFLGFCLKNGEELDIEEAALQLAATEFPGISFEGYRALLDDHADSLRPRLAGHSSAQWILHVLNKRLFEELGFAGNEENYYAPHNSYLNCVLDQRLGNPISLCLLLVLIGRRLALPITGIGLPGHFICRYQSPTEEIYLDPFNHGQMLTKQDCIKHLVDSGHGFAESALSPWSGRKMLLRICLNLHHAYMQAGQPDKAARFQRYVIALSN